MVFRGKEIIVGITGGIAAYKSVELVSTLKKRGAEVNCIMTEAAREFITPLTLGSISQNPVYMDMFREPLKWNVEHIALADRADLFMVVPATANLLGKICHGLADDMLSTTIMATKAPVLLAPAMNVNMYDNPIVQDNLKRLEALNYCIVGPAYGPLACGYEGQGRLAELSDILAGAEYLLVKDKPLRGKRILITAGPTREALDPVRYLTNHSTGKMGYALAKKAYLLGAEVTLISGPTNLSSYPGVTCRKVETAQEMYEAVMNSFEEFHIIIKSAAVADFRPRERADKKIKKDQDINILELERTTDILAELGMKKGNRVLIGFAAETHDVTMYAADKAKRKNLDFIVANDLSQEGAGFGNDTNIITFVFPDGTSDPFPLMSKEEAAEQILQRALNICVRS